MIPVSSSIFIVAGDLGRLFPHHAVNAWALAENGDIKGARRHYEECERTYDSGLINPELSLLRHSVGFADGITVPPEGDEDKIATIFIPSESVEEIDAHDMKSPVIDQDRIEAGIRKTLKRFDPGIHRDNIVKELEHVLFVSTGRCGTKSIYHLLKKTDVFPFHDYWWMVPLQIRWEQMCRLIDGGFDQVGAERWCQTRAAEWLGSMAQDKPMIGLNHTDTIFAAVFAALHPKAKIVYLRRDPIAVFKSFWSKAQWNDYQLRPINYAFDPDFRWCRTGHDMVECLAWYIRFTDLFAAALKNVLGDRMIEISADKLFVQDREEIKRLVDFIGVSIPINRAVEHFSVKINEKAHKIVMTAEETDKATEVFKLVLTNMTA